MFVVLALVVASIVLDRVQSASPLPTISAVQHGDQKLRFLVVGDSIAGTLGVGLARAAPASGVTLINGALVGCGVAVAWDDGWASSIWLAGPPGPPCQSPKQLSAYWRSLLVRYRPDVVFYANRMDTVSQEVDHGSATRMTSVLDKGFQRYLERALTQATTVLASTGAHVILATSPPTKLNLTGNATDNPRRWLIYDKILHSVASKFDGRVTVFNLGKFFGGKGPTPVFELKAPSGVQWRCDDGIHFSAAAGILVAPSIFDMAWRSTTEADITSLAKRARPVPASIANQPWKPFAAQAKAMGCPP